MSGLSINYVTGVELEDYFVSNQTGLPLANGSVYFYVDTNRTQAKTVYELNQGSGWPPSYTYTPLPNPITLSNTGTVVDTSGNNVALYYYPYDTFGNVELYYIEVYDSDNNLQFTREAWPYPNLPIAQAVTSVTATLPLASTGGSTPDIYIAQTIPVNLGGTGVASFSTPYGVICAGTTATNPLQVVASIGSSGDVLTSNGAGVLPTFQAPASMGAYEFIGSQAASNSPTISFINLSSSYSVYELMAVNIVAANSATGLRMLCSTNNGSSYDGGTNYGWAFNDQPFQNAANVSGTGATSDTSIHLFSSDYNTSSNPGSYRITFFSPNTGVFQLSYLGVSYASPLWFTFMGAGMYFGGSPVNAIQFAMGTGNITSGNFYLYGIKAS